ncbi:MAG: hypothetical protein ABIR36_13105 [Nitrospiraceae bacterium]
MPEALTQPATLLVKLHGKGSQQIELTHETVTIDRKADNTLAIMTPLSRDTMHGSSRFRPFFSKT